MTRYFTDRAAAARYVYDQLIFSEQNLLLNMTIRPAEFGGWLVRTVTATASEDGKPQTSQSYDVC